MKHLVILLSLILSVFAISGCSCCSFSKDKSNAGSLRHVVLFEWKEDTSPDKIREIEDSFRALPEKISVIADFEWGTDVSVEGLAKGFSHAFLVTFESEKDREVYLPHPEHKKFVKLMKPYMKQVLVIDYFAKE